MAKARISKFTSNPIVRGKKVRVTTETTFSVTGKDGLLLSSVASAKCPIGRAKGNSCDGKVIRSVTYTKPADAKSDLIKKVTAHFKAVHPDSEF